MQFFNIFFSNRSTSASEETGFQSVPKEDLNNTLPVELIFSVLNFQENLLNPRQVCRSWKRISEDIMERRIPWNLQLIKDLSLTQRLCVELALIKFLNQNFKTIVTLSPLDGLNDLVSKVTPRNFIQKYSFLAQHLTLKDLDQLEERGEGDRLIRAIECYRNKRKSEGIEELTPLLESNNEAIRSIAQQFFNSGVKEYIKLQASKDNFQPMELFLKLTPFQADSYKKYFPAYIWAAQHYINNGDFQKAEESYNQVKNSPYAQNSAWAQAVGGMIACHFGRYVEAQELLENVSGLDEKMVSKDVIASLARTSHALGHYVKAEAYFAHAIELLKDAIDPKLYFDAAANQVSRKKFSKADELVEKALRYQKDISGETLALIGEIKLVMNDPEEASRYLSEAIAKLETQVSPAILINAGLAKFRANKLQEALEYFESAISKNESTASPEIIKIVEDIKQKLH